MHSRKSVFYKGIVFIASFLMFTLLASIKVEAACSVTFTKNDSLVDSYDEQYVTIAGDLNSWQDRGLQVSGEPGDDCSGLNITKVVVNGKDLIGVNQFVPKNYQPGHYTIGYDYKYNDNGTQTTGTIYRYLRILDSTYSLENNYTLGAFDFKGDTSVVESFYIGDNWFVSFVVNTTLVDTTEVSKSYVVVSDSLGRVKLTEPVTYNTDDALEILDVLENKRQTGSDTTYEYFVVGNVDVGGVKKGFVLDYIVTSSSVVTAINQTWQSDSVYNSGYLSDDGTLYVVGQNKSGQPVIEKKGTSGAEQIYKENTKGEYRGITVVDGDIYAVGYTTADNVTTTKGLYTYISDTTRSLTILDAASDTKFNDIIFDGNYNIIVGETKQGQIYLSNGSIAATNANPGFLAGLVLQVSTDATAIKAAYLVNIQDTSFRQINQYSKGYSLVGKVSDGAQGLLYTLKVIDTELEIIQEVMSTSNDYLLNGVVDWDNGYAYFGALKNNNIMGVYYPLDISDGPDALFLTLDNRALTNFENKNFKVGTEHKFGSYVIKYGAELFYSEDYKKDNSGSYSTVESGVNIISTYAISTGTGALIYVYRTISIVDALPPINLTSSTTGILKWYVYNRVYTYINTTATRYETTDFNYWINGDVAITLDEMIDSYFANGHTKDYNLRYSTDTSKLKYTKTDQTTAAFASVEYARKFAYYQEFARVVRKNNYNEHTSAVNPYPGKAPDNGQDYYIYYIDFKGAAATGDTKTCYVSATRIENCTSKSGYAFKDLNSVKETIEALLKYNNYFVSTRNTLYNGSVPVSKGEYAQDLVTKEYLKEVSFGNQNTEMVFNVLKEGDSNPITSENKNVYFGGSVKDDVLTYKNNVITATKKESAEKLVYFENDNAIYFPINACYKVYYSSALLVGTPREFCLDNTAPEIVFRKDGHASTTIQSASSSTGTLASDPLYIETDFKIIGLNDLDGYSFIYVNGNRYPITCANNSATCLKDIETYIKQAFRYDEKDPMKVRTITFSDRLENKNTFYFVIGTKTPQISIENQQEESFTLVIDFYKKNPITTISTSVYQQQCNGEDDYCYDPNTYNGSNVQNPISDFVHLTHCMY